jgi:hypothetical protein
MLEECTISGGTAGVRVAAAHTGWTISGTSFIELETGIFSTIATDKSANDIGSMKDNTFQKVLYEFQSPAAPPAATPTPAAPAPQPSDATPKDSQ